MPPGDVEALSEALSLLVNDAGLRDRMSAAARCRALALPRWKDTAASFLCVLRELVAKRAP